MILILTHLEYFIFLQRYPLTICFEIIWLAMIIMLILFARNPAKRKWVILFLFEFAAVACAIGLIIYYDFSGIFLPGEAWDESMISLGAACLYVETLLVTAVVSQWATD